MSLSIRPMALVAAREVRALLLTPLFWVLSGVYFLISSLVFVNLVIGFSSLQFRRDNDISADVTVAIIQQHFWALHFFLLIMAPLLTMRSVAEERRQGTLNLIQTTPLGEWSLVAGKFLANAGLLALYLALTLVFPLFAEWISDPDWAVAASCYTALLLASCAYTAVGLFFSSLTDSQVIAAVLTYVSLFGLLLIQGLSDALGSPSMAMLTNHLAVMPHVYAFLQGNISMIDVAYFAGITFLFLYFTVRQIESLRWRNG